MVNKVSIFTGVGAFGNALRANLKKAPDAFSRSLKQNLAAGTTSAAVGAVPAATMAQTLGGTPLLHAGFQAANLLSSYGQAALGTFAGRAAARGAQKSPAFKKVLTRYTRRTPPQAGSAQVRQTSKKLGLTQQAP